MSKIRDEIGKILDMRIPPNGYRRYIYEIDRTGGFTRKTILDMLIVLSEATEEMEQEVAELKARHNEIMIKPTIPEPELLESDIALIHKCPVCLREFKNALGLMGHSKTHKDATTTNPTESKA